MLSPETDYERDGGVEDPRLVRFGDTYYLTYTAYNKKDAQLCLATSKDLKVWRNVQDEPVLKPGPGDHDKDLIALNQVVKHKGRYYAYYHGSAKTGPKAKLWSTCVATSTDLVRWEKYAKNPLLPPPCGP